MPKTKKIRKVNVIRKWGKIMERDAVMMNTIHFAVEVKENPEGIIIDVFHRHGDLISTYTFWNDDTIDEPNKGKQTWKGAMGKRILGRLRKDLKSGRLK